MSEIKTLTHPVAEASSAMNIPRKDVYSRYFTTHVSHGCTPLGHSNYSRYFQKLMIRRAAIANKEAVILDLGCGYGRLLLSLKRLGYRNLRGVDISEEQVLRARELGLPTVTQADALSFLRGVPEGEVDVIYALDVLEHIAKDSLVELVSEVRRALKPGGRFLIHVPNGEAIFSGKSVYGDLTHQTAFTKTSLAQLLRVCGFDQISCFEDRPIIHGTVSLARNMAWLIIRLAFVFINFVETGSASILLSQNFTAVATKPPQPVA
jgi:SAM-dependent methyltransferase